MKFIIVLILFLLVIFQCSTHKAKTPVPETGTTRDSIPVCIQQHIEAIKNDPKWNPPAQIDEYNYEGKRVFLFSANCCDQYNILYDDNCKTICAPSGGFTGKGDGKCEIFFKEAQHIRLVWKDQR